MGIKPADKLAVLPFTILIDQQEQLPYRFVGMPGGKRFTKELESSYRKAWHRTGNLIQAKRRTT